MVKIELGWKGVSLFLLIGFLVFVSAASWPYSSNPGGQYHGANEIWVKAIDGTEMSLQDAIDSGLLVPESTATLSPSNNLINGQHSSSQCEALGGEVTAISSGSVCKLPGASCSVYGWARYLNWGSTKSETFYFSCPFCVTSTEDGCQLWNNLQTSCSVIGHTWKDEVAETCQSVASVCSGIVKTATTTEVGCY